MMPSHSEDDLSQTCIQSMQGLKQNSAVFRRKSTGKETELDVIDKSSIMLGESMGRGSFNLVKSIINKLPHRRASMNNPNLKSSRKYAVKSLRSDLSESMVFNGALDLAREAMFLSAISHPNIIILHSTAQTPGRGYFLVIEQLDTTLTDAFDVWKIQQDSSLDKLKLRRAKRKAQKVAMMINRAETILGLASALSYLHGENILYRDLKPANIGMNTNKDDNSKIEKIKIFDFGLATELKETNKIGHDAYNATKCTGSPRYMSQENFYGLPYGKPADVYSFAFILYQVISLDTSLFLHKSLEIHEKRVYKKKIRPKVDKSVPEQVRDWIQSSWSHDPSARPTMESIYKEMGQYFKLASEESKKAM